MSFGKDNGGAIPSNLLQIPNTESNGTYINYCKLAGVAAHPARFPSKLPQFFINFLTEEGDIVLDIFSAASPVVLEPAKMSKKISPSSVRKLMKNCGSFEGKRAGCAAAPAPTLEHEFLPLVPF